jgi:putative endopeptidase
MQRFHAALGILLTMTGLANVGCGRPRQEASTSGVTGQAAHDLDVAGMDRSAAPGDDFFAFANGAWLRTSEIPSDRSSGGIWTTLAEQALQRTRALLEQASAGTAPAGSDERKVGDYYAAYLDEAGIEARGTQPLADALKEIAAIKDRRSLATWVGRSLRTDVDPLNATEFHTDRLFGLWISPDFNEPSRYASYLLQGGLGLPDREYYLDRSPRMEAIRSKYKAHIASMLSLSAIDGAEAKAARIFDLEARLAAAHLPLTDSENVLKANNPWPLALFAQKAPGLDWSAFFSAAGLQSAGQIIVWQPSAISGIAALAGSVPLDVWKEYLTFEVINHNAGLLPKAFVDERFAFYGKELSGTPQLPDRWKRAVGSTGNALPDPVGRMYVQKFFPASAKAQLQTIVKDLETAFGKRIDGLTWMDPKTKESAHAKLATLRVGIGYPDSWRDYSTLEIEKGDALGNASRAELFEYQRNLAKLGRPVDRDEWWITPQTVNALNLPVQNGLNFPAAILEPPFFDPAADAAVQYGSIGAIIGHEISHSFDDQGSQFDANGRLADWWTSNDLAHFKDAASKLVAQYNNYQPFSDLHVNGQQTLSENIADLAGLSVALDGYRLARQRRPSAVQDGFSDEQRFFVSFGQSWRSKTREAAQRQRILTDGHAPDAYRAATVRNIDAWYAAFDVKPGQRLYLEPMDRVRVW